MVSTNVCKNILKKHGLDLTKEEINKLREILYQLAEFNYKNTKYNHLHESINERTSRRYGRGRFLKVSNRTGRPLFKKSNIDHWLNG